VARSLGRQVSINQRGVPFVSKGLGGWSVSSQNVGNVSTSEETCVLAFSTKPIAAITARLINRSNQGHVDAVLRW